MELVIVVKAFVFITNPLVFCMMEFVIFIELDCINSDIWLFSKIQLSIIRLPVLCLMN